MSRFVFDCVKVLKGIPSLIQIKLAKRNVAHKSLVGMFYAYASGKSALRQEVIRKEAVADKILKQLFDRTRLNGRDFAYS